jgi:hypothetical protein
VELRHHSFLILTTEECVWLIWHSHSQDQIHWYIMDYRRKQSVPQPGSKVGSLSNQNKLLTFRNTITVFKTNCISFFRNRNVLIFNNLKNFVSFKVLIKKSLGGGGKLLWYEHHGDASESGALVEGSWQAKRWNVQCQLVGYKMATDTYSWYRTWMSLG